MTHPKLCSEAASHYHDPNTGENVAILSRAACEPGLGHLHLPLAAAAEASIFDCTRVWYDLDDAASGAAGTCGYVPCGEERDDDRTHPHQ